MESVRLNKYLADAGICSRREADRLIEQGVVTVNGAIAKQGMKVSGDDCIVVRGKAVSAKSKTVVLAYNKPIGVTCTEKDKFAKKTIRDAVQYPIRVTYAGRLDKDSEGLLLLTNDGNLIQKMMKGAEKHEKEYLVTVNREVTDAFLNAMQEGVFLKDLDVTTRPCTVSKVGKYKFRIVLTQGLNRQIRRMCMALGYQVTALKRERVLCIELGDLETGSYRELSESEIADLRSCCNMEKQAGS